MKNNLKVIKIVTLLALIAIADFANSQMVVTTNSMTVEQYIQTVLLGGGVTISNVQFNGGSAAINNSQVGSFSDQNNDIGLGAGSPADHGKDEGD